MVVPLFCGRANARAACLAMDVASLRSAYADFLAAAHRAPRSGAAASPPWAPELVVAHVAANDELLAATTADLIAGRDTWYDNAAATMTARLQWLVREAGSWDALVDVAADRSRSLCDLAAQLDDDTAETPVPVRIIDGRDVRVDERVPWGRLLVVQAEVHLPAHTEDLLIAPGGPGP